MSRLAVLIALFVVMQGSEVLAEVADPATNALTNGITNSIANAAGADERFELKREVYKYTSEGKRDPFLSLIEAAKQQKKKAQTKGLVPTEEFDVAQMTLVAVVWEKAKRYALIALPDGKYYTIKEGMVLGIHSGKVISIVPGSLTVREYIIDYKGNPMPQDTVLRLRQEEEK